MAFPVHDASGVYRAIYRLVRIMRPFCFRVDAHDAYRVPVTGGVILASNHTHGFEVFAMGLSCHRQIHFMAKKELFDIHPWLTYLIKGAGAFPVRRGQGDKTALETAVEVLHQGKALGIYPEGTRHPALARGKSGTVRTAMMAGVPVLPVGVAGTREAAARIFKPQRRGVITVRYGEPITFTGDPQDPVAVQRATTEVMVALAGLLPPPMRGVYANGDLAMTDET
ncbi:MAG: 1-acyl-sn-glycerol-3-phosphate acyltransferase [Caldilineaceae bacterium]|nr:1-acyl-sn-glycerol-3-phosphate acyltransferase [Caldilineaceae bacterium]MBP8106901.1 1-acyl-sn-glycerol-3-phosphate acyltransferase [Caldilineaceae bacterium]MBP9072121.1 1-acyl-sn-glycerol-3-phosphate acyltransferase [Caldilineaceae bacterium]